MTGRTCTDDDLRTEAARLLARAAASTDDLIRPAVQRKWGEQVDAEVIDEACDQIVTLLDDAADLSRWAVNLGADGLEPTQHEVTFGNADGPFVRLHLAFHPSMPQQDRDRFHAGVKKALRDAL